MIYHGCGNASMIFADFIEMGVDPTIRWRPSRASTWWICGRKYGHRMGFCGNMDVLEWANAPEEQLRR